MATRAQAFYGGSFYHIYNRGNHREPVFKDNDDRRRFLSKLDELCECQQVTVAAYCLMDNHFHLLLRQERWVGLAKMMRSLMTGYVKYVNYKYGLVGHLFQGPYQSRFIRDQRHLAYVSRYTHRNPVGFADIRTFRWSSYRQYLGGVSGLANSAPVLELFDSLYSYTAFVESAPTPEIEWNGKVLTMAATGSKELSGHAA